MKEYTTQSQPHNTYSVAYCNKFQIFQFTHILVMERKALENVVHKFVTILLKPRCVE